MHGQVPPRYLLPAGKPNFSSRLGVVDELAQGADAMGMSHNMGMQAEIHDAPGRGAFSVKLIEAILQCL